MVTKSTSVKRHNANVVNHNISLHFDILLVISYGFKQPKVNSGPVLEAHKKINVGF